MSIGGQEPEFANSTRVRRRLERFHKRSGDALTTREWRYNQRPQQADRIEFFQTDDAQHPRPALGNQRKVSRGKVVSGQARFAQ